MKIESDTFLNDLIRRTTRNITQTHRLDLRSIEQLGWKSDSKRRSALECILQLNMNGDYYLPKLTEIVNNSATTADKHFVLNGLNYFLLKNFIFKKNLNPVKTFCNSITEIDVSDKIHLDSFIHQQVKTTILLHESKHVSLNNTKVPLSKLKWLNPNLGNTLKFVVHTNEQLIQQAFEMCNSYEKNSCYS